MSRLLKPASLLFALLALALALPVLSVLASWLQWTPQTLDLLREMASTVLPDYAWTSALLCLMVALGVTVLGLGTAAAVTLFDFRGRTIFEWLLLLPLAMPAYVVAYAYTDFLQFSGPLQVTLREAFGWRGALWPDVRSVWGAALVFTLSLYPYVYLLARTALLERVASLMEAARLLGASLPRRIREVALPLSRPAVAAGVALALMETLADFGPAISAFRPLRPAFTRPGWPWTTGWWPRSWPRCCWWWCWACCSLSSAPSAACVLPRAACRARVRPSRSLFAFAVGRSCWFGWLAVCRCCWALCCRY
jgi:ABC-type Fe3+ transport system permease subunit